MATLEYFIVCESTSVDAENNQISLFHVLDDIFPDRLPLVLPRADAVCVWNLSPEDVSTDFQASLTISPPGEVRPAEFRMNLSHGHMRHRAAVSVTNIPLFIAGELRFEAKLNGAHSATHIVRIHDAAAVKASEDLRSDMATHAPR
jgi:hypothetical protein